MRKIEYIGCFLPQEVILEKAAQYHADRLYRCIGNPHVTFAFQPDTIPYEAFGNLVTVKVVSYGRDEENEAFGVELEELPEGLLPLYRQIEVPHITISVSRDGKPVNSRYLPYEPITPFVLQGVFGGMGTDGIVYTKKHKTGNGFC